jgi:hypothetical protein
MKVTMLLRDSRCQSFAGIYFCGNQAKLVEILSVVFCLLDCTNFDADRGSVRELIMAAAVAIIVSLGR